jgi:hypothetical protein
MGKLTPLGRLVVVLLILGGIFAALKFTGVLDSLSSSSADESTQNITTSESNTASDNTTTAKTQSEERTGFSYTPVEPQSGKLKGVVELGASGFNSFIIKIDEQKNWKLEKAEFGNSLVLENMASDADIQLGLKRYIGSKLDFGVPPRDIHFVVSSGAAKAENAQKIIAALKSMKYVVNTVTAEQEGILALKCALPPQFNASAFVVDIGSGNTKISWREGSGVKSLETYGSKYFQEGLDDNKVYDQVAAIARQVPAALRGTCFIIGGTPFKLAKEVRQEKERFTLLKSPGYYSLSDAKDKAGTNIYRAIRDATDCQTFVFDWDANFTIGFLLELPY